MATSISSLLVECLGLFNALVARKDLASHDAEVPVTLWADELGRLRVWAANIGAHQNGQSSLDYRLRDASHIKNQIVRLLERLRRSLCDLQEALSEPPDEGEDELSDDEDTTEVEQIYNGLVELIKSLFQMSMLIRCPARHDRLLGTSKEDIVTFEPYDRKHVHEKYPRADHSVLDRLGTAISRRRADLKYRERHHAKLSQGINKLLPASTHDQESTVFSDTIATDFKEPNIQFDDAGSNSGVSQTSYAPTLLNGGNAMTVPPPPKESANEQPFECPYCFFITTIKNKRSWARHVFRDIMPYMCIFPECSTPNRLYDSRRGWYRHVSTAHMSAFSTDQAHECPLCQASGLPASAFEKHLGRHLEELALFAIPRPMTDKGTGSDQSSHALEQEQLSDVSTEEELEGEGPAETPSPEDVAYNANLSGPGRNSSSFVESGADRSMPQTDIDRQREEEEVQTTMKLPKDEARHVEDQGLSSSLNAGSSFSTKDGSNAGGGEKSYGAMTSLKRLFGFGRKQGTPETKAAASGESGPRTGTRAARPETTQRTISFDGDHDVFGLGGLIPSLNRRRNVDVPDSSSLFTSDEEESLNKKQDDPDAMYYDSDSDGRYGSGHADAASFDSDEATASSRVYGRTISKSRIAGQSHEIDLPNAKPTSTPPERSSHSPLNPRLLETVEDAIRRLILPELKELKKDRETISNRRKFDRDFETSYGSGSSVAGEQSPERDLEDGSATKMKSSVIFNADRKDADETLSKWTLRDGRLLGKDADLEITSERSYIGKDKERPLMTQPEVTDDQVVQKDRSVRSSAQRPTVASFNSDLNTLCRPARDDERYVMRHFAAHVSDCSRCAGPHGVYVRGDTLCDQGLAKARDVAQYVYVKGRKAYSVLDRGTADARVEIEIPPGCDAVRGLLQGADRGIDIFSKDKANPVAARRRVREEADSKQGKDAGHLSRRSTNAKERGSLYWEDMEERSRWRRRDGEPKKKYYK